MKIYFVVSDERFNKLECRRVRHQRYFVDFLRVHETNAKSFSTTTSFRIRFWPDEMVKEKRSANIYKSLSSMFNYY